MAKVKASSTNGKNGDVVTQSVTSTPETDSSGTHEIEVVEVVPQASKIDALQARIAAANAEVAECRKAIQAILPGDRPVALHEDRFSPANMQRSMTYIPDALKPRGRAIRWGHKKMVDYHRGQGWSPCDWDRMKAQADEAGLSLRWTKTAEGHIQNGDLILLETSHARLEELQALKAARNKARDGQAMSTVKAMERQLKERYGEQVAGMDVFEGERGGGIATQVPVGG